MIYGTEREENMSNISIIILFLKMQEYSTVQCNELMKSIFNCWMVSWSLCTVLLPCPRRSLRCTILTRDPGDTGRRRRRCGGRSQSGCPAGASSSSLQVFCPQAAACPPMETSQCSPLHISIFQNRLLASAEYKQAHK